MQTVHQRLLASSFAVSVNSAEMSLEHEACFQFLIIIPAGLLVFPLHSASLTPGFRV